ncbi:MAG: DNA-processing protein DprA, partial [Candidatus Auribacterota bacterium]|nr:DNA-processing protein DprA [Candidatus Auribacterota bacterium]
MNQKEYLVILNLIRGLGTVRIRGLMDHFGSAADILKQPASALIRVPGIGSYLARAIRKWEELEYREEFRLIEKLDVRIITIFDSDYPENLREIYDPPVVLYIKGSIIPEDKPALAVVGSRRASHYGLQTAEKISYQLAARGFTVVSGLARGIDTRAHRGALKASGRTIAVLGSGLGNIYPPENGQLAKEISLSGAVISEFPIRAIPDRQNFPLRNRVVSGLSLGVLVVEAAQRSGALITARLAMEQGRSVMAIPGRIDSFSARGTNSLIQDGARMVNG